MEFMVRPLLQKNLVKVKKQQRSAVQVGDPFMEKLLLEACLDLIKNHQDILIRHPRYGGGWLGFFKC